MRPEPDPFRDLGTWGFEFFFTEDTVGIWAAFASVPEISERDVDALRRLFARMPEPFLSSITLESTQRLWEALRRFRPPKPDDHWPSAAPRPIPG
jgi:hypothetical protein